MEITRSKPAVVYGTFFFFFFFVSSPLKNAFFYALRVQLILFKKKTERVVRREHDWDVIEKRFKKKTKNAQTICQINIFPVLESNKKRSEFNRTAIIV